MADHVTAYEQKVAPRFLARANAGSLHVQSFECFTGHKLLWSLLSYSSYRLRGNGSIDLEVAPDFRAEKPNACSASAACMSSSETETGFYLRLTCSSRTAQCFPNAYSVPHQYAMHSVVDRKPSQANPSIVQLHLPKGRLLSRSRQIVINVNVTINERDACHCHTDVNT